MNFGEWLREHRTAKNIELLDLAGAAGTTAATISRIENDKTRPTFLTAIGLCFALDLELDDIARQFLDKYEPTKIERTPQISPPSIDVVIDFSRLIHERPEAVANVLTFAFIRTQEMLHAEAEDIIRPTPKSMITWLTTKTQFYELNIFYPPLQSSDILQTYGAGGAITKDDFGIYIKNIRANQNLTRVDVESKISDRVKKVEKTKGISDNLLKRLEAGEVDRFKLEDILLLANTLTNGQNILSLAWSATELGLRLLKEDETVNRVAILLIKIMRWVHYLAPQHPEQRMWAPYHFITGVINGHDYDHYEIGLRDSEWPE